MPIKAVDPSGGHQIITAHPNRSFLPIFLSHSIHPSGPYSWWNRWSGESWWQIFSRSPKKETKSKCQRNSLGHGILRYSIYVHLENRLLLIPLNFTPKNNSVSFGVQDPSRIKPRITAELSGPTLMNWICSAATACHFNEKTKRWIIVGKQTPKNNCSLQTWAASNNKYPGYATHALTLKKTHQVWYVPGFEVQYTSNISNTSHRWVQPPQKIYTELQAPIGDEVHRIFPGALGQTHIGHKSYKKIINCIPVEEFQHHQKHIKKHLPG